MLKHQIKDTKGLFENDNANEGFKNIFNDSLYI